MVDRGEDKPWRAEAGELARKWLDDYNAIPEDVVSRVLGAAAMHGNRELYDRFAAELAKTEDSQVREEILGAMARFRDPALIKQNFNLLLRGEIDQREGMGLLYGPLGDVETRAIPFELITANYDQLVARLPSTVDSDMAATLPEVGASFCDERSRGEVASFFKDRAAKASGSPQCWRRRLNRSASASPSASSRSPPSPPSSVTTNASPESRHPLSLRRLSAARTCRSSIPK